MKTLKTTPTWHHYEETPRATGRHSDAPEKLDSILQRRMRTFLRVRAAKMSW